MNRLSFAITLFCATGFAQGVRFSCTVPADVQKLSLAGRTSILPVSCTEKRRLHSVEHV